MAHLERGAYEPHVNNLQAFDAMDEDDIAEEGSRLPVLIAVALLVLFAFAGVVWLAYTQGVQRGRADAPRAIIAQSTPPRSAAAHPAVPETPYAGLKIYQPPTSTDEDTDTAPPPPTPAPVHANQAPSLPVLRPSAGPATEASAAPPAASPSPGPQLDTTSKLAAAEPGTPAPTATPAPPAQEPVRAASHAPRALVKPAPVKSPPENSAPTAPATPAVAPAAPVVTQAAPAGTFLVQVGSYKSQSEANGSWRSFKAKYGVADTYQSDVKEVDLGDKGTWFRLRVGGFPSKEAASEFCAKLKAQGASCLIAR